MESSVGLKRALCIALAVFLGLAYTPGANSGPLSLDSLRIVVLGSSTAAGTGPSSKDSAWVWRYRAHLASLMPESVVHNLAVGGYTTYQVLPTGTKSRNDRPVPNRQRNLTAALSLNPDAIIINLPSNDAAEDYSIREQLRNYNVLKDSAAEAGVPLWVATTQPRNLNDRGRGKLIEMRDSTYSLFGDRTVDFWTDLARDDGSIDPVFDSGDGVHLNDSAHKILFERMAASSLLSVVSDVQYQQAPYPPDRIQVYPNPAQHHATVLIGSHTGGEALVEFFDATGRRLDGALQRTVRPGTQRLQIELSHMPAGLLVVRVTIDSVHQSATFFVAR